MHLTTKKKQYYKQTNILVDISLKRCKAPKFWTIDIIIIIMSCRQHGYPWPSLATSPYHSSPRAGLQGYILCPHIVAVCKFVLVVLLLHIHMWGSTGVHRLWARPCSSLLLQQCPACLVRLTCIVFVMGGKCLYSWCFVGCCRQNLFNTIDITYFLSSHPKYGEACGSKKIILGESKVLQYFGTCSLFVTEAVPVVIGTFCSF